MSQPTAGAAVIPSETTAGAATTVIDCHVASLRKLNYTSLVHWLSSDTANHVYIGRKTYVAGSFDSKWRNPFKLDQTKGNNDIKRVLKLYLMYLKKNTEPWFLHPFCYLIGW